MFTLQRCFLSSGLGLYIFLSGCSHSAKSPEVSDNIRASLKQAGLRDVSVAQDRDKGVVTLTGKVTADSDKAQAESIARSLAAGQVVSDEIAVLPPGDERLARAVNSDVDQGIQKNLDAALLENGMEKGVKSAVKNGVVTLTGEVDSQSKRSQLERTAAGVPYVRQVVNEVQVRDQKATSSN
jgi:osmotically-inducible protein OsmY